GLWSYCIKFTSETADEKSRIFFFKKVSSTSVATDDVTGILNKIKASFDASDTRLTEVKHEYISFENKFDCVLYLNTFYIFSKSNFEKIADIEEEFIEHSAKVLSEMQQLNMIEGLEILQSEISAKPSLMRTLAHIAKKDNHSKLGSDELKNMKETLNLFE